MLAQYDSLQTTLADNSGVCAKKDVILAKLDQLLAKLAAQGAVLNATDAASFEVTCDFPRALCCVCDQLTWSQSLIRITAINAG
jgi:hypothetical protein